MAETTKKWTESQVVEAFEAFVNPDAQDDPEQIGKELRGYLKGIGESFGEDDVGSVVGKFVPSYCVYRLATAIIDRLNASVSPIVLQ